MTATLIWTPQDPPHPTRWETWHGGMEFWLMRMQRGGWALTPNGYGRDEFGHPREVHKDLDTAKRLAEPIILDFVADFPRIAAGYAEDLKRLQGGDPW